ncbi:MAG TPA: AAA family ATPase [Polyangiales bacterium]|nr:AAA family ATPase [Polyangiales bacterium]
MGETEGPGALVGRDEALARLEHLLGSGRRLITLRGAPGVGKTALVRRLAARLGRRVRICDLTNADSAAALAGEVSRALGAGAGDPVPQLEAAGELLLILDHVEHIAADVAAALEAWLAAAPQLRCLVSSRDRLRVAGEVAYQLAPLSNADAVALFCARASEARDDFVPSPEERALFVRIAERLDGIPLALELAAAELVVLSPAALYERLEQPLALLDAGQRNAPERTASLRGSIACSYRLLSAAERDVLEQCSVFRGGFSLEAAERVVVLTALPVVNVLRDLCDRSLVRREDASAADGGWFRLLWSVAAFASERLAASGGEAAVLERHAAYYASLAPAAAAAARRASAEQTRWALLERNLRAVVERSLTGSGDDGVGHALRALALLAEAPRDPARLIADLDRGLTRAWAVEPLVFAGARLARAQLRLRLGHASEAREEFSAVAEGDFGAELRARAWLGVAHAHRQCSGAREAEDAYAHALAEYERLGDQEGQARVLTSLAGLHYERAELASARSLHERALAQYRALGDAGGAAVVLQNTGLIVQELGELDEAEAIFREAQRLHVEFGQRRFEGIARFDLAGLAFERGRPEQAHACAAGALEILAEVGDRRLAALSRALRGAAAAALGRLDSASADLECAAAELAQIDDRVFAEVVRVQAGHLELAHALGAHCRGEDARSAAHRDAAARLCNSDRLAALGGTDSDELRLAVRCLRAAVARASRLGEALCVSADHDWLRGPGAARTELGKRKVLSRLLAALVERRLGAEGAPLTAAELIRRGWPDQRIARSAASNRLQVALTQLRRAGLGRALVRRGDGYALDPKQSLVVVGGA